MLDYHKRRDLQNTFVIIVVSFMKKMKWLIEMKCATPICKLKRCKDRGKGLDKYQEDCPIKKRCLKW